MKHYTQANRFLQKYGFDAFKIIAAYEEATGIPQTERYASYYGDYGIFEPSLNEDMTYDKLLSRYNAGLKCLGIIHEQAETVCNQFLSEQLAEYIRGQLSRHNADGGEEAIAKNETQSVCVSTAFYIGGENDEDE